jgi:hypothetical protein
MVFADFEYPFMQSLFANTCILISSTGASFNSQATSGLSSGHVLWHWLMAI